MKNYKFITTEDGSETAYSELYGEACHSTSGAVNETNLHYIKGCKVAEKASSQDTISILEVGLGIGIGLIETVKALKDQKSYLNFVSMEIDEDLVKYVIEQNLAFLKDMNRVQQDDLVYYQLKNDTYNIFILIGDARKTVPLLSNIIDFQFDCIYQDAFSPKRNAILWTVEWFKLIKSFAKEDVIMSTYSSSSSIRMAMVAAGWKLYKGDKFGKKRSSTRATLLKDFTTEEDIAAQLGRSGAVMLTDENAADYVLER